MPVEWAAMHYSIPYQRSSMISIPMPAGDLAHQLNVNREKHVKEYNEAMDGYRKAYIDAVEAALNAARAGHDIERYPGKSLIEPQSHEDDYLRAERMMSHLAPDTPVHLSEHDYARLVMDEWDWKQEHIMSNQRYTSTR